MEKNLERITHDIDGRPTEKKKGFWSSPFGKFTSTYLFCRIAFGISDYLLHQQNIMDSFNGPNDFYFSASLAIATLNAIRHYVKPKTQSQNVYTTFLNPELTDGLLKEIIEGESNLNDDSQKLIILNQFWSSLPNAGRRSIAELEYLVMVEGWDEKPLIEMIKHYVPSTVANLKGMNRIEKSYSLPHFD